MDQFSLGDLYPFKVKTETCPSTEFCCVVLVLHTQYQHSSLKMNWNIKQPYFTSLLENKKRWHVLGRQFNTQRLIILSPPSGHLLQLYDLHFPCGRSWDQISWLSNSLVKRIREVLPVGSGPNWFPAFVLGHPCGLGYPFSPRSIGAGPLGPVSRL